MARIAFATFLKALKPEHLPGELGPVLRFRQFNPAFTDADLRYLEHGGLIVVDWVSATFRVTSKAAAKKRGTV